MGVELFPSDIQFPDIVTPFGDILFDFEDHTGSFIVIFSRGPDAILGFWQGELGIQTTADDFELHKEKLLREVQRIILESHSSGIELQKAIIVQLRLSFRNLVLSYSLERALNP